MLNVVQYIPYMDPMGNEMVDQNAACWDVKRSRLKNPDGLIPLPVPVQLFMTLWGTVLKNCAYHWMATGGF